MEIADHEATPEGSLSATANWGDGTSTSATVKAGSVSGCFLLSNGGHSYANPGAVTFSYTIHNSHTGVNHTTDEEQFTVWSVPVLIPGSTPRTIHAQIGVPWSGVVGEFSYDSAQMSASQYTTRIDWGDLLASPGTITALPNGRFTVSATHIYTEPFEGKAVVDVFGSYPNTLGLASWPIATVLAAPSPPTPVPVSKPAIHYKLLRTPILAAIPTTRGAKTYELIFRLSHRLPTSAAGDIEASLGAYDHRNSLTTFGRHRSHACYAARVAPASKRAPRAGSRVPFSLSVRPPGTTPSTTASKAALHLYPNLAAMLSGAGKALSC